MGILTPLALLMPAFSLPAAPTYLTADLHRNWNAPLPSDETSEPCLRRTPLASMNFRRIAARPVSCYAFFKGWLLLSQPPGCFSGYTSFHT